MDNYAALPADLGFTPGLGAVRLAQRTPGEPPSKAGHVFGFVSGSHILEARAKVQMTPWAEHTGPCQVWRHTGLSNEQRLMVAGAAMSFKGKLYGAWKIGLQLVDWALAWSAWAITLGHHQGEIYAARRLQFSDDFPNCHQVWDQAYRQAIGYQLGVGAHLTNPDQMLDYVEQSPHWEKVYEVEA